MLGGGGYVGGGGGGRLLSRGILAQKLDNAWMIHGRGRGGGAQAGISGAEFS